MEGGGPNSCLVHHTRARAAAAQPRPGFGFAASLNSPFSIKTLSFLRRLPLDWCVRHDPSPSFMTVPNNHEQVYIEAFSHLNIYIHSFHIHTFEREFANYSGSTANTGSAFFCWKIISSWETNCHYSRSTTARAILVLRRLCPTQDLICKQVLIILSFPANIFAYCLRFCKLFSIKRFLCISSFVLFFCY